MREQYFLARKANIPFSDTNNMPDFERQLVVGMLSKDLKEEKEDFLNKLGTN